MVKLQKSNTTALLIGGISGAVSFLFIYSSKTQPLDFSYFPGLIFGFFLMINSILHNHRKLSSFMWVPFSFISYLISIVIIHFVTVASLFDDLFKANVSYAFAGFCGALILIIASLVIYRKFSFGKIFLYLLISGTLIPYLIFSFYSGDGKPISLMIASDDAYLLLMIVWQAAMFYFLNKIMILSLEK